MILYLIRVRRTLVATKEASIKKIENAFDNRVDAERTLREIKLLCHMYDIKMKHKWSHQRMRFEDVYIVQQLKLSTEMTDLDFLRSNNSRKYVKQLPRSNKHSFRETHITDAALEEALKQPYLASHLYVINENQLVLLLSASTLRTQPWMNKRSRISYLERVFTLPG
ncbi:hypothetical protein HID58_021008 [Brassica napus]|uniref:Uncharacterized protein n=1 Tax=Brassica napus TaxID=3708 RepID=A0ABQ8CV65_BRANA|nr:hypothetical protein HID58_021008 [Brassica napus]